MCPPIHSEQHRYRRRLLQNVTNMTFHIVLKEDPLEPIFFTEKNDHDQPNRNHQQPNKWVTKGPLQFRNVFKIHPINSGNKSEWNKDRGNNCQHFHNIIHAVTEIGLLNGLCN